MSRKRLDAEVDPADVKSFVFGEGDGDGDAIDGSAEEKTRSQSKSIPKAKKSQSKGKGIMTKLAKPEKEATKRFNADFPVSLHKRLRSFCANNDISMGEFAMAAIEQALDEAESDD